MSAVSPLRSLVVAATIVLGASHLAAAQAAPPAAAKHPAVCGQGVRVFTDASQAPIPRDTVRIPASDTPVRVTSPEEAEAAELALRARAGSVGATGIIISDEVSDDGGGQRIRRNVTGFFAPADSARAQAACKK